MKGKINIHNFWRSDAFIILMFALMSVMSVAVIWHAHFVSVQSDLSFHWQRIYEIHESIAHGHVISNISLNKFNQTGSAVMSLYPNLNMYCISSLLFIFKPSVALYYIIYFLRNFVALIVGYYACRSFNHNKKISLIFSAVYTLNTVVLFFEMTSVSGMSSSIIFMPLVLFGFLNLLEKNKWVELTLGMSAIILCHVLDSLFIALFLLIFIIINIKKILDLKKLEAFFKFIAVTLSLTSVFIIPFLILMINNPIGTPPLPFKMQIEGQPIKILISSIIFHLRPSISLMALAGLILGIIRYKKLTKYYKQMFWIAILFVFICSNLFPWEIFHHTIIETLLQFSWRLYVIPELLLSYLFSFLIIGLFHTNSKKKIATLCIISVVILIQITGQFKAIQLYQYRNSLNHDYYGGLYSIYKDTSFNKLVSGYTPGRYDYYPKQSIKMYDTINHHLATYDGNEHIKMKLLGNGGYEFSNKVHIKNLSLPFLYYNGIDYQVKLDGKTVNGFANKNSLMTIKNVNKGQHHVRIIVHNTKMQIVSYITSLIGLIILLGTVIRKYILCK